MSSWPLGLLECQQKHEDQQRRGEGQNVDDERDDGHARRPLTSPLSQDAEANPGTESARESAQGTPERVKSILEPTACDVPPRWTNGHISSVVTRSSVALLVSVVVPLGVSGCAGAVRMHSVDQVRATFADHGLDLSVVERNRVSTSLLPAKFVRALRKTPALGTPPPSPGYEIVVFTNRGWLRALRRHQREAGSALGTGRSDWSRFTTRHDNVFIVYPAGVPKNLARLKRILDDI